MATLQVQDLMTDHVFSVRENEDLAKLTSLMEDIHVRHVPVVDEEGILRGLVSHRDLLSSVLYAQQDLPQNELQELLKSMTVQEIMVEGVETAEAGQDIVEAGNIMLDNKLGCLPVVEGDRLVGILTEADFVKFVVKTAGEE